MTKECRLRFGDWSELFDKKGNVLKDFNARLVETISQEDEDLVLDTNYKIKIEGKENEKKYVALLKNNSYFVINEES